MHWALCRLADVPRNDEWLGSAECAVLATLRYEKRRNDWRLGRWTAKVAMRSALGHGAPARLGSIEIVAAADGAPEAWIDNRRAAGVVAISHRAGAAVCAASERPVPLGCDVEVVEARSGRFVQDYFTSAEADLVARSGAARRDVVANLVWSAKESTLKALRTGLRRDTRTVEVEVLSNPEGEGWGTLDVDSGDDGAFSGIWRTAAPDLVITVVSRGVWTPRSSFEPAPGSTPSRCE